jgi:hypothetical protein
MRTGIAGGQYQVAGQLVLDVHVPLLHHAMLDIGGHVNEASRKGRGVLRRGKGLKPVGDISACFGGRLSQDGSAV